MSHPSAVLPSDLTRGTRDSLRLNFSSNIPPYGRRCTPTPFSPTFSPSLSLPRSTVLHLRWCATEWRDAIDFKIRRRTLCASSPPSPPPVVSSTSSSCLPRELGSQCHRCGGTGGRLHGDMIWTRGQDRRVVIANFLSLSLSLSPPLFLFRNEGGAFFVAMYTMRCKLWKSCCAASRPGKDTFTRSVCISFLLFSLLLNYWIFKRQIRKCVHWNTVFELFEEKMLKSNRNLVLGRISWYYSSWRCIKLARSWRFRYENRLFLAGCQWTHATIFICIVHFPLACAYVKGANQTFNRNRENRANFR